MKDGALKIILIIGVGLVAGGLWWPQLNRGTTVTISGVGTTKVKAETAQMIVSRVDMGDSASSAINGGEIVTARLVEVAKKYNGEVKRNFYQLTPQSGKYVVANAMSIKIGNPAEADKLVRELYDQGATTITNLSWGVNDNVAVEAQAKNEAIKDATNKAEKMASAMGKKKVKIVAVTEESGTTTNSVSDSNQMIEINRGITAMFEIK